MLKFKRKQLKFETVDTKTESKMTHKISKSLNRAARWRVEED